MCGELWPYMLGHMDDCIDPRGKDHLQAVFADLAHAFGCSKEVEAAEAFRTLLDDLRLGTPKMREEDLDTLTSSVNPIRMKNFPIVLSSRTIQKLYHSILSEKDAAI